MKRLLMSLLVCAPLAATPALAGLTQISGTGVGGAIANENFSAGSSVNVTTTHALSAGDLLIMIAQGTTGSTSQDFSCSDAFGNTYSAGQSVSHVTGAATRIWYSVLTNPISNGSTITCSVTSGLNGLNAMALAFSGAAASPYDSASASVNAGTSGTGTRTVGPTGTLNGPCGSANCEVLVGAVINRANGTVTMDANFTRVGDNGASTPYMNGFWIVSATTAESYSPSTNASSAGWAGQLQGFMAAAASGTNTTCTIAAIGGGTC